MIQGITNNSFLAAVFGSGTVARNQALGVGTRNVSDDLRGEATRGQHPQPVDTVEFSARSAASAADATHDPSQQTMRPGEEGANKAQPSTHTESQPGGSAEVSPEEEQEVRELEARDREVRQHEAAHAAAAGPHARGGPSFEYETGPDGKRYAVGGEVQIDTSPVKGNPQATITKMQQVRRAAKAPANPSGQDRAVAAKAAATEQEARAELARQRQEERTGDKHSNVASANTLRATVPGQSAAPAAATGELLDLTA